MNIKMTGLVVLLAGVTYLFGAAGVTGTPHDMSARLWDGVNSTEDNGEICVYCHTPHAASTNFTPIWNKNGATAANGYTLYGTTMGGTVVDGDTSGSLNPPSMACLSCHDGATALNSVVNVPGSGLGDGIIGTNGELMGAGVAANLGTSLTNDHPVYTPYNYSATPALNVAGLKNPLTAALGSGFVDDFLRTTGSTKYVECGTCHDPHNGADTKLGTTQVAFLRQTNVASALCLACHDK
ncbi:MAG: hypothetical protein QG567_83 [Campylobacterota bacterium]|nr:hypothetical protein [Campylobacterota bacterium]